MRVVPRSISRCDLMALLYYFPFRIALILNTRRAQPWWGERRGEGRVKWAHLRPQYCHSNEYSWFGTTWHGGHDGRQYNKKSFQRIDMKMDFSSQRREVLLFLTTNISSRRDFAWKLAIISSCESLRDTDVKQGPVPGAGVVDLNILALRRKTSMTSERIWLDWSTKFLVSPPRSNSLPFYVHFW